MLWWWLIFYYLGHHLWKSEHYPYKCSCSEEEKMTKYLYSNNWRQYSFSSCHALIILHAFDCFLKYLFPLLDRFSPSSLNPWSTFLISDTLYYQTFRIIKTLKIWPTLLKRPVGGLWTFHVLPLPSKKDQLLIQGFISLQRHWGTGQTFGGSLEENHKQMWHRLSVEVVALLECKREWTSRKIKRKDTKGIQCRP